MVRTRMLWADKPLGRISLRFGHDDFRRRARRARRRMDDQLTTFSSLSDSIDRYMALRIRIGLPNDKDGIFQPPPKPRARLRIKRLGAPEPCLPIGFDSDAKPLTGGRVSYGGQAGARAPPTTLFRRRRCCCRRATKSLTIVYQRHAREVQSETMASEGVTSDRTPAAEPCAGRIA